MGTEIEKIFQITDQSKNYIDKAITDISLRWRKSVEDILHVCLTLANAKDYLGGNNKKKNERVLWSHFLTEFKKSESKMSSRTIEKLTKIGEWSYVKNNDEAVISKLPAAWSTIYDLCTWSNKDDRSFLKKFVDGKSGFHRSDIERSEVHKLREGKDSSSESTTKRFIGIEVDIKKYGLGSGWDMTKLKILKEEVDKNLSKLVQKLDLTINTSVIDEVEEKIEKAHKKNVTNRDADEEKTVVKLGKLVDKKLDNSGSLLKQLGVDNLTSVEKNNRIAEKFHNPRTIDNYISVLHGNWKVNSDVLKEAKIYTGLFDSTYFSKKLEKVSS